MLGRNLLPEPSPDHGRSGASILSTRCLTGGVVGQPLNQNAVMLQYDFNIAARKSRSECGRHLLAYYQAPLVDNGDVYIESKDGTDSNDTYSTQKWHQNKDSWHGNTLAKVWTFEQHWFAVDRRACSGSRCITPHWRMGSS